MLHNKPPKSTRQRGYSFAELLSVIFILGLFTGLVVLILNPIVHSSSQAQAKLETIQTAAQAFYRIQRDLRRSADTGTLYCPNPTCTVPALAISSALQNGDGQFNQFSPTNTQPSWQGTVVYWLPSWPNTGPLLREFRSDATGLSPPTPAQLQTDAQNAENNPSSATTVAMDVKNLLASVDTVNHVVSLTMLAQSSEGGATNNTSYQSNTVPRNSYPSP